MYCIIDLKRTSLAILLILAVIFAVFGAVNAIRFKEDMQAVFSQKAGAEHTLVIDAGHGGEDGGAQSREGLLESGVNLDIAQRLRLLAAFCGVDTVMTRDSEDIGYPDTARRTAQRKKADQKARAELINATPNAILVSVHQNKFPDGRPRGPEVLYAHTDGSRELAEIMQFNLTSVLYPENRRVAAPVPDSIYLIKSVHCPAVIAECGFLSNAEEARLLGTPEYRLKIAVTIIASYLQFTDSYPFEEG